MNVRERLEAMLAEANRATPGPWCVPSANVHRVISFGGKSEASVDAALRVIVEHPSETAYYGDRDLSYFRLGSDVGGEQSAADRRFIAAARTNMPLVIRAMLAAIEQRDSFATRHADSFDDMSGEIPECDARLLAILEGRES